MSPTAKYATSTRPVLQKMLLKPGMTGVVLNAPKTVSPLLSPPEGAKLGKTLGAEAEFVLAFVEDSAAVKKRFSAMKKALSPDTLLWFAYPKKSSGVETDLTRDAGWDAVNDAGWQGIAQIAIDETWAATRFRPSERVKSRAR